MPLSSGTVRRITRWCCVTCLLARWSHGSCSSGASTTPSLPEPATRTQCYLDHDRQYYEGEAFGPALAEVAALARNAGVPLDVVVIPYEAQLRPDAPAEALHPQERLAEAADSLGMRMLDATEALRGHASDRWYLYGDGIHLSAEGHGRIERFLTEML